MGELLLQQFLSSYEVVCNTEHLTMCLSNKIFTVRNLYMFGEENELDHLAFRRVLHTIIVGRMSYRACVTYGKHHACNLIPVMLGTPTEERLTQQVHHNFRELLLRADGAFEEQHEPLPEYLSPTLYHDLRGYCVDDGHLGVLPSLIMNNREKLHRYVDRNQQNCRVIYMYNFMDRGSVLKLWDGKRMLFRDQNGKDHVGAEEINKYFSSKTVIGVDRSHTFDSHDWLLLNIQTRQIHPIDSFHNKIVLTPAVIMYRVLMRCRTAKNVTICRSRIASGQFHFFLSQTTTFQMSHTHHGANMLESFTDSNLIRRPLAHQLGATYDSFFQITRVSKPHLKLDQPYPYNSYGFLCPYYFSSNISNFSKTLSLVEDVVINFKTINVLNDILAYLSKSIDFPVENNKFTITPITRVASDAEVAPRIIPGHIIVQECIATRYCVEGDLKHFLIHLKQRFDSAFELTVESHTKRVYINAIAGTVMKLTPSEIWAGAPGGEMLKFTSLELEHFFNDYYTSTSFPIHSVPVKALMPYTAYEEPTKSITTASQLRNRLLTDQYAHLFNFSNEITGTYLGLDVGEGGTLPQFRDSKVKCDIRVPVQANCTFKLKTLICSDLHLNEDAYVLNERLNFNILIKRKYNINLPFSMEQGDRLILERNPLTHAPEPKVIYKYDPVTGKPILITFIIGTLYTRRIFNRIMIYKINLLKIDENVYLLYRQCDQSDLMQQNCLRVSSAAYHSQNTMPPSSNFWVNNKDDYHQEDDAPLIVPPSKSEKLKKYKPDSDITNKPGGSSCESTLFIYLYLEYRLPYYSGLKLCNFSGQKGLTCTFKNLSAYRVNDVEPDVLVSAISIASRKPLPQLKEMAHYPVAQDPYNPNRLIAETTYFALKNRAMDMAISCNIKIDNLTAIVMSMNNLNYCLYHKSQDAYPPVNYSPISAQLQWVGFMYAPIGKGFVFDDEDFNKKYQDNFINKVNGIHKKCIEYLGQPTHNSCE